MRALLDVNVLIALLDAAHMHHARATQWLQQEIAHGWASCPLTQNGCLRIMAQPAYPQALALAAVASRLAQATAHPAHTFVPDDYSLLDAKQLHWQHLLGHRQITKCAGSLGVQPGVESADAAGVLMGCLLLLDVLPKNVYRRTTAA